MIGQNPLRLLGILGALAATACGVLVDEDVGTLALMLPKRTYNFDADEVPLPSGFWNLRCDTRPSACCERFDCSRTPFSCSDGGCALAFTFESWSPVTVNGELGALTSQRVQGVALRTLHYEVSNESNFDLPDLDLFLAPHDATTAADPRAQWLGRLPATPAGGQGDPAHLQLEEGARALFSMFASTRATFNVIVAARVEVSSKMKPLRGQAQLSLAIEVEARLAP